MKLKFGVNFSAVGMTLISFGSLSIGLQTGVVMAGRSDPRGTVFHWVAPGIWGGCLSILTGICSMMSTKRGIDMPMTVPEYYRHLFITLFTSSLLGFLSSIISIGLNAKVSAGVSEDCREAVSEFWNFGDLFCYGSVAAVILIVITIVQMFLLGVILYFCILTFIQLGCQLNYDGRQRLEEGSITSLSAVANCIVHQLRCNWNLERSSSEDTDQDYENQNPNYNLQYENRGFQTDSVDANASYSQEDLARTGNIFSINYDQPTSSLTI